jgi:hypothetical protein
MVISRHLNVDGLDYLTMAEYAHHLAEHMRVKRMTFCCVSHVGACFMQ